MKKVRAHEKARTTRDTTEPPEPHYYGGRGGYEGRGGGGFRGGYRPYRGYRGGYRGGYYGDRYDHHEDFYSSRDRRERSRSPPRGSTSSRSRWVDYSSKFLSKMTQKWSLFKSNECSVDCYIGLAGFFFQESLKMLL